MQVRRGHAPLWSAALVALPLLGLTALPHNAAAARLQTRTPSTSATRSFCPKPRRIALDTKHWVCTFDDEFDPTTNDAHALDRTKWAPQRTAISAFTSGPKAYRTCYRDSPKNIAISNGLLQLTVRRTKARFFCRSTHSLTSHSNGFGTQYTAGSISGFQLFAQAYGRFAVRAKLPQTTARGLQETLWLWPVNDLKYGGSDLSGEIDFAEFYSQYPHLVVPYIHYGDNGALFNPRTNTNIVTRLCPINRHRFHTYTVTWSPGTITLVYDKRTCIIDHYQAVGLIPPAPFDQPFFVALTAALGVGANAFNPATTPLPATTKIDYVRVWQRRN